MYNTDGGYIIFGIEERKDENNNNTGEPERIFGIEIENSDKLIQSLEDIITNNTEPSISNLQIKILEIEGKNVVLVGTRKFISLPTMVTYKQTNKFYKRRNSGKYAIDVYELKNMFTLNQEITDKIQNFRNSRISQVLSKSFFPNIEDKNSVFLHIIPLGLNENNLIDFMPVQSNLLVEMKPMASTGWDHLYNLEGFATFSYSNKNNKILSYNQIFRNGSIESYSSEFFYEDNGEMIFYPDFFIQEFFNTIKKNFKVLETLKINPPFYISFSLHNILNNPIAVGNTHLRSKRFQKNDIVLPLIMVDNYDSNLLEIFQPIFNILYQSIGYSGCPELKRFFQN